MIRGVHWPASPGGMGSLAARHVSGPFESAIPMSKSIGLVLLPDAEVDHQIIHAVVDCVRRQPSLVLATHGGAPEVPWDELGGFRGDGFAENHRKPPLPPSC